MKHLFLTLLLCLMPAWAWGANCGGETACACGDTVTSSYTLTGDLACTNAGVILTIGANDVTLDLGGFTIDGDDTNTVTGVDVLNFTGVTIRNGTITDCTEDGVQFRGTSTGTVSSIASNSHGNQGFELEDTANVTYNNISAASNTDDGFSMHSGTAVINTGTFTDNAESINIIATAHLTGNDLTITSTGAQSYAISLEKSVDLPTGIFNNVTISGTYTSTIRMAGATATFTNLVDTSAATNSIAISPESTTSITNAQLSGTASNSIILHANVAGTPTTTLHRVKIDGTNCTNHVVDLYKGTLTATASIIDNIASGKYGFASRTGATLNVYHVDVLDSNGSKNGNGIYAQGTVTLTNSILSGLNTLITLAAGTPTVDHNLFYDYSTKFTGAVTSTNEILADPLFLSATDFRLQAASPAIDAGVDVGLTSDFIGTTVPWGPAPDIGAYEYFISWSLRKSAQRLSGPFTDIFTLN